MLIKAAQVPHPITDMEQRLKVHKINLSLITILLVTPQPQH